MRASPPARGRALDIGDDVDAPAGQARRQSGILTLAADGQAELIVCLLYTSDAADERSSVVLGGRRLIKKKNNTITA